MAGVGKESTIIGGNQDNEADGLRWLLLCAVLLPGLMSPGAQAVSEDTQHFNPDFLRLSDGDRAQDIDLSWFSEKGGQAPGAWPVDVIVNGERVEHTTLSFRSRPSRPGQLFACLREAHLARWGIEPPARPEDLCRVPVSALWPGASEQPDTGRGQWRVSIPQKYLTPPGRMRVPPRLWEQGLPALLLNYDYSGWQQSNRGQHNASQYLGFDGSLSVAGWRLRNLSNWTQQGGSGASGRFTSLGSWLQHDYSFARGGMFTVGQTAVSADLFDSFSFDGVKAESDDGMLRSELVTWSPVIRGIANSQAQVTVRQNGILIYQKTVPPGPFELRDISMLNSGDLQVEIREADGSVRGFTQVAASVPVLQREGGIRYSLAAGRYRNRGLPSGERPLFVQGTLAVGLPAEFTVYGGLMASKAYMAALAGAGRYCAWLGAFSLDITQAQSRFKADASTPGTQQGQSLRFSWARGFDATGTAFSLAGYRYASRGFYTFTEWQERNVHHDNPAPRLRSRVQLSVSQPLGYQGVGGSFSLSGSRDNWRDESGAGQNWTASYSTGIAGVSASLSLGLNASPRYGRRDRTLMVNLSAPLSRWRAGSTQSLTSVTSFYNGRSAMQLGLTGAALEGQASYALTQGWREQGGGADGNTGSASLSWQGGYGQATGSYSYQREGHQWNYGLRGGVVVHPYGVTLSRSLSMNDGNALVMAPGAAGVRIKNANGLQTNRYGYAVVPNLTSYQHTRISLDVSDLAEEMEAKSSDREVAPTRGALVASPFRIAVGYRALITLESAVGAIPLGASVEVKQGEETVSRGIVDNGQVYLSGLPHSGTLQVSWYNGAAHHCRAAYRVTPSYAGLSQITARCR